MDANSTQLAAIVEDTGTTLDTLIKDVPTVAEFEARTIAAADYVVVTDTIAGVTAVTNGVTLADDAITAAKFDESTAYPLKSADTGATAVARTGADSDTLETLSDQIDGASTHSAADVVTALGDGSTLTTCATATGFSTHSASDVKTAIEAAGSSIASILEDTGTTLPGAISGLNDVSSADVQSAAAAALTAYDPPTKAELDAADDAVLAVLGSPAGASISADIAAVPTALENADALLARDIGSGTNAVVLNERTVRSALRALRNKLGISSDTITVYTEDDETTAWTAAATTDSGADPITEVDPT